MPEIVNQAKLDEAWEIFNKAAELEARTLADPSKSDNMKRVAVKHATKKLDEAVELEREAFGESDA